MRGGTGHILKGGDAHLMGGGSTSSAGGKVVLKSDGSSARGSGCIAMATGKAEKSGRMLVQSRSHTGEGHDIRSIVLEVGQRIDGPGASMTLAAGAGDDTRTGGSTCVRGGQGRSGGLISLHGVSATSSCSQGNIYVFGGDSSTSGEDSGGLVGMTAGCGSDGGNGGKLVLVSGLSIAGVGGSTRIFGGKGNHGGGEVVFATGNESEVDGNTGCLLYTSPSPRDQRGSRMPSSA